MCPTVYAQMKRSPCSVLVGPMLPDFPLACAKDFQPGTVSHPVRDVAAGRRFYADVDYFSRRLSNAGSAVTDPSV